MFTEVVEGALEVKPCLLTHNSEGCVAVQTELHYIFPISIRNRESLLIAGCLREEK